MSHNPTAEQQAIQSTFAETRRPAIVVQAGAGTGKTTTMRSVVEANPGVRFKYLAFNRSIVDEASASFPQNCEVRTFHSHAYRAIVKNPRSDFGRRLNAPRMKSDQVARQLGIHQFNITYGTQSKVLQPGYLAGAVMRAIGRFCDSADTHPHHGHFEYIDGIDAPEGGKKTYDNNDRVRGYLEPFLALAWADLTATTGRLRFDHAHYLKMWELGAPRIDADALIVDEGQDLNPVMLSICEQQTDHLQLVAVGDSQQSIYGWRGAVDALDRFDVDVTLYLTQSFRFGPAIADVANAILTKLDAELRLTGLSTIASDVARLTNPACYLMRTNALAVQQLLTEQVNGRAAYLIGGGKDVLTFVRACVELQTKGYTSHPELSCFTSWNEVQAYVAEDPSGSDLGLMVRLVEEHGGEKIQKALERMPEKERDAEVVISTAHKAKGREWASVKLGSDFRDPKDGGELQGEEWRLCYVACTRGQQILDPYAAVPLARLLGLSPDEGDGPGATAAAAPRNGSMPALDRGMHERGLRPDRAGRDEAGQEGLHTPADVGMVQRSTDSQGHGAASPLRGHGVRPAVPPAAADPQGQHAGDPEQRGGTKRGEDSLRGLRGTVRHDGQSGSTGLPQLQEPPPEGVHAAQAPLTAQAPITATPPAPAPASPIPAPDSGTASAASDAGPGAGVHSPPNPVMASTPRSQRPPTWLIGKCSTAGCRFGIKLFGHMVIENHRFRGVTDPDGKRVAVPSCPDHGQRPWLKVLHVLPPDGSRCNSSCQHAFKAECACACQGENHGKAHLVDVATLNAEVAS